ncbi:MAG: alpha/beta hydrolase [Spirochaetales bacterium]|nr:alpha/beta hydrolase [Spirochaetales bacterium]
MNDNDWSIKKLMGPVITRLIAYGTNPIDIERIMNKLEGVNLLNSRVLEENWWDEWHSTAQKYIKIAKKAEEKDNHITAREMYYFASSCYYAAFLINYINMEHKKQAYMKFMDTYKQCISHYHTPVEIIEIPVMENKTIPGYLHLPGRNGSYACVIILTGIGTSKEETHFSAGPFIERGIAVVTMDIPGIGESLFFRDIKFQMPDIIKAISRTIDYLGKRNDINYGEIGVYGICMGGSISYKAASFDRRIKFCISSFPIRIEKTDVKKIPLWIREGKWPDYYSGSLSEKEFTGGLVISEDEVVKCPFFLIHGRHDNWTPLDDAMELFHRVKEKKEFLIIEDEPTLSGEYAVTHMITVGEQHHWIKHIVADWAKKQITTG